MTPPGTLGAAAKLALLIVLPQMQAADIKVLSVAAARQPAA
jgi:hypothetical protein